ncbi:MAG: hypothetical protein M1602_06840, partial [Firmicutes bacterium]|nr:hypothetical protein [Bacillota bacterium]
MQTYEAICDLLLDGAEDAGLFVASVEHYIETITLDKEFIFICLPPGERTSPRVRAEISFVWDSTLTAASVYGQPRRLPDPGDEMDLAPPAPALGDLPLGPLGHPLIELYIKYQFNVPNAERVPELADRLRRILRGVIDHENFPEIKFEVSVLPDGKVVLQCEGHVFHLVGPGGDCG